MCDVEAMFHQFKVAEAHRNFLRFLWWEDGDTRKRLIEYRMTVHLFGAGSTPGCANFGLKRIADDHEEECGSEVANFVRNDFYVDDGLKSVDTVEHATTLIQQTKDMCAKGGSTTTQVYFQFERRYRCNPSRRPCYNSQEPRPSYRLPTCGKSARRLLVRGVRHVSNAYHPPRYPSNPKRHPIYN